MKKILCFLLSAWVNLSIIYAEELQIEGNDVVEIAMQGESIAQYHVPQGYQISLQKEMDGVVLDEQALLHVTPDAKEGTITIIAQGDQTLTKDVQLIVSWTMTVEGAQEYQIPSPSQTRRIDYMDRIYQWLPIPVIQIGIISIASLFILVYVCKRRKR